MLKLRNIFCVSKNQKTFREDESLACAEVFLKNKHIPYVKPGKIGECRQDKVEVVFLVPEALDPNLVIDPPDIRLWVNRQSGAVEWILQM